MDSSNTSNNIAFACACTYTLIADEEELRKFYQLWIQPYQNRIDADQLVFHIYLKIRKKYYPEVSNSRVILKRVEFRVTQTENDFVRTIRQLEVKIGCYVNDRTDKPIPDGVLSVYITAEPSNEVETWYKLQEAILPKITAIVKEARNNDPNTNPNFLYKALKLRSNLTTSFVNVQLTHYQKFDVDTKDVDKIGTLYRFMNECGLDELKIGMVMVTRGGYHIYFDRNVSKDLNRKIWEFCEVNKQWITRQKVKGTEENSTMMVIPGTWQSDFKVKMITIDSLVHSP